MADKYSKFIKGPERDQPKVQDPNRAKDWEEMCDKGFDHARLEPIQHTMVCIRAFLEEADLPQQYPYWKTKDLKELKGDWRQKIPKGKYISSKLSESFPDGQSTKDFREM